MISVIASARFKQIQEKFGQPLGELLYNLHWQENLRHREIADRIGMPRPTITRWFHQLGVPTQSCTRFTNLNLLNVGPVMGPRTKPKIKKESPWKFDKNFFKIWSPELAYVLGFISADGYVFKNRRGSHYVCFCSTDREIIEKIRNAIKSNHAIGVRSKNKNNPKWKNLYVLQIGSKEIVIKLRKFGIIQNKSLVIDFPKSIPRNLFGDFVRGYFDGDGGVFFGKYKRKNRAGFDWIFNTSFTSGSKKFLLGLQSSLQNYVAGGNLYSKKGGYSLGFSRRDSLALFRLMYNNIASNLFLDRKYQTFLRALKTLDMRA